MSESRSSRPVCTRCLHYHITYDPRFPYGCRAMGFKSRALPHTEVEAATGMACQSFQPRLAGGKRR
ncbi:MAG: hypothetical protein AB1642_07590 [Pseudomonadota bacterium]